MQTKIELFSQLLRELEADIGTRDLSDLVFVALIESIKSLDVKDSKKFSAEFSKLVDIVTHTEPKFGILNYYLTNLHWEFEQNICTKDVDDKKWKRMAINKINAILKSMRKHKKKLFHHAEKINVEGKTILIHDHSHTVQDALRYYRGQGKHFRVVIAEQDYEKTHDNIECLHAARIPFQVVPAYMISHVMESIDMVFFGALTLKDTMHFVMSPGTHGVITEFHAEKVPIYAFFDTCKFSLWKSKKRGEIFIHKHTRSHYAKPIEYERIKYSHDRVPINLFKKIVTDKGVFSPAELEKLYKKTFDEYEKIRKKH